MRQAVTAPKAGKDRSMLDSFFEEYYSVTEKDSGDGDRKDASICAGRDRVRRDLRGIFRRRVVRECFLRW